MGNGPDGFLWEDAAAVKQMLWPLSVFEVSFTNYASDGPSMVQVLWDDNNVITDVSISDLKVAFHATGNKGNALIAAYDRYNTLLWSWHIWCTDSPQRLRHEASNGVQVVMLDRNLGATSTNPADGQATYGYWYQWGRKDPLKLYPGVAHDMVPGTYIATMSMEEAVINPTSIFSLVGKTNEWFNGDIKKITADLWGNPYALNNGVDHLYPAGIDELRKTIYDPCPPGYMVPPEWAWDTFSLSDCDVSEYGLTFTEENGESFYPFAGFGDAGDQYGGDSGWYGYPGYTPNKDAAGKYHHNVRNVMACWSSSSASSEERTGDDNYQDVNMFYYLQYEESNGLTVMVNENSPKFLYPKYSHIRQRCCSVRCMKIQ